MYTLPPQAPDCRSRIHALLHRRAAAQYASGRPAAAARFFTAALFYASEGHKPATARFLVDCHYRSAPTHVENCNATFWDVERARCMQKNRVDERLQTSTSCLICCRVSSASIHAIRFSLKPYTAFHTIG